MHKPAVNSAACSKGPETRHVLEGDCGQGKERGQGRTFCIEGSRTACKRREHLN